MKKIILATVISSGLLVADLWRDPTNGIVIDTQTYIEWQDDYNASGGSVVSDQWADAIKYCEALNLGDNSDWRLPNANELISLADYNSTDGVPSSFMKAVSAQYWTSTSDGPNYGYNFYLGSGYVNAASKTSTLKVMCVRLGR